MLSASHDFFFCIFLHFLMIALVYICVSNASIFACVLIQKFCTLSENAT